MKIKYGGFNQTTLIDYPGEVSSIIFLPGCNLSCPYCHNPSIVNPIPELLEPMDEILKMIFKRKNVLTGVVISGGEPTLYDDLDEYIKLFQKWNLKVKVDTNGTKPEIINSIKPDYFAMDLKTSIEKYPSLGFNGTTEIIESLEIIKESGIDYEIRTTAAPLIFTESDLYNMIPMLLNVKRYYITNFRNGDTLNPTYNLNSPYSKDELLNFVKICRDAGISCSLR